MSFINYLRTPRSVQSLPVDRTLLNYPRRVVDSVFATVPAQPLANPPRVIGISLPALALLTPNGASPVSSESELEADDEFKAVFAGTRGLQDEFVGYSHCYWGTQFGNYAGQLGDGAATLIAEGGNGYEINLKGSGRTPFSRGFDGRKVIRSSVREFLCSEAMAGLGIPTTRAGSVIASDTSRVFRDINYTGQPIEENCAVVSRIARTFFRFGSFESQEESDSHAILELAKYTWSNLLKPLRRKDTDGFMDVVIDRTAFLVAEWQAVGFVHGVMNTDNMSIIGDTIDYGPFGFVESYDPHFVPNTSDRFGRYALSEQPRVAAQNCERLYGILAARVRNYEDAEEALGWRDIEGIEERFLKRFRSYYDIKMRAKLGLPDVLRVSDQEFNQIRSEFLSLLDLTAVDYSVALRALTKLERDNVESIVDHIFTTFPSVERMQKLTSSGLRINREQLSEVEAFASTRLSELQRVGIDLRSLQRWRHKFDRLERFSDEPSRQRLREQGKKGWKSLLQRLAHLLTDESRDLMASVNPIYIPRQSILQQVIDAANNRTDKGVIYEVIRILGNPYVPANNMEAYELPNLEDFGVCLSCSS